MRTFYRIEIINALTKQSAGGYMAAIDAALCHKLGILPGYSPEELQNALNESTDPDVKELFASMILLCDIPVPTVCAEADDKNELYCLYNKEEFNEAAELIRRIESIVEDALQSRFYFQYKKFKLKDSEILYEDNYQIVISKDIYDKHKEEFGYEWMDNA